MSLEFMKFKFTQKTSEKPFCRYRIISNNPYSDKQDYNGNSVRYKLRQKNRQQFIYNLGNEYILTYNKIKEIPAFEDGVQIELVNENEVFPITNETLDLYKEWIKYFVSIKIKKFCNQYKGAYDYKKENRYKVSLFSDKESGIIVLRVFSIDTEVLTDGTAYLSVDIRCEFESSQTIFDYIRLGKDIINLRVGCDWQGFERTYKVTKLHKETIIQDINGFNLYAYWQKTAPWRLEGIGKLTPAVSVLDEKKNREGLYIPQSLKPVITKEYIAVHNRNLSKKVDQYTKLSMKKRLEIIQGFLNDLNFDGVIINISPTDVTDFGYEEYNLAIDMPDLMVGNNRKIKFSEKYKTFNNGYGFYKLPENTVTAAFLGYGSKEENPDTAKNSHDIVQAVLDYTRGKIGGIQDKWLNKNMLPLTFYSEQAFYYNAGDTLSYKEKAQEIKKISGINFVMSTLPIETDEDEFYKDDVDSPYESYKCAFADLNLPSQMISINMVKDLGTKNVAYRLQNIILGILSKSGGVPWILQSPMDNVDCFIGLDVGTQEKGIHYPACSVCLDGTGNLIGYYSTSIAQKGEKIDSDSLKTIFDNVMLAYKNAHGNYPKHIVVHRDGFSSEGNDWYIEYFKRRNIEFDLVEIRKNISTRLINRNQISNEMNPDSGAVIIKDNEAYLVSTDVKSFLGSPRPLMLVHRYGNLSIQQIARQVYVLSEMHIGSMRTSRLPITTLYADKICKHHNHVPHDALSDKLYFI
ncbi:MAG: Piwi domain-containing protein [Oscillospiraceae bacterium]